MPAEKATPEAINFMARYGRGLICMPITRERCAQLGLKLMVTENREAHRTQFTTSIDAASGSEHRHLGRGPRHHHPRGGTLRRKSPPTWSSRGTSFLSWRSPAGCSRAPDTPKRAATLPGSPDCNRPRCWWRSSTKTARWRRRPELEAFALEHGLKLGTIADLIRYRMMTEKTVRRVGRMRAAHPPRALSTRRLPGHRGRPSALRARRRRARPRTSARALIRVHVSDSLNDLTGSRRDAAPLEHRRRARDRIASEGSGSAHHPAQPRNGAGHPLPRAHLRAAGPGSGPAEHRKRPRSAHLWTRHPDPARSRSRPGPGAGHSAAPARRVRIRTRTSSTTWKPETREAAGGHGAWPDSISSPRTTMSGKRTSPIVGRPFQSRHHRRPPRRRARRFRRATACRRRAPHAWCGYRGPSSCRSPRNAWSEQWSTTPPSSPSAP